MLVVLGGLFVWLQPQKENGISSEPRVFELTIKNNTLAGGPEAIRVTEGEDIVIKITSDASGEVHVHGYDKTLELTKDVPAELAFRATITGRFEYELEDTHTPLGALEVLPK